MNGDVAVNLSKGITATRTSQDSQPPEIHNFKCEIAPNVVKCRFVSN